MTIALFILSYVIGAAALALWFDLRFPKLRPTSWVRIGVATAVAMGIDQLCTHSLEFGPRLFGVIGVILPSLALSCLVSIWLLRMMRAAMPA